MDLGDTLMYGGRLVVPLGRRPMCTFSAFMRFKGALAGEFSILSGDSLAVLEFGAAASEFVSSRGGNIAG
jgi:hypothetical protein